MRCSGLASAKVLLQSKSFHVTIFEKKDRIGGIWAIDRLSPHEGYLHPDTPTNLSRFTVAFSDLDWNAIGLDSVPMFPKAWQVNQYLEAYRTKNVPSDCFRFRHHITKTEKTATSWRVTALDREGREHVQDFNYLLIGSGFFSQPRPIKDNVPNVATALKVKTMHSSEFRTLDDLFANRASVADQKILMIGGGNSAGTRLLYTHNHFTDSSQARPPLQWLSNCPMHRGHQERAGKKSTKIARSYTLHPGHFMPCHHIIPLTHRMSRSCR